MALESYLIAWERKDFHCRMLWEEEKDAEMDVVGLGCVH